MAKAALLLAPRAVGQVATLARGRDIITSPTAGTTLNIGNSFHY
jgi:hypothetical protein